MEPALAVPVAVLATVFAVVAGVVLASEPSPTLSGRRRWRCAARQLQRRWRHEPRSASHARELAAVEVAQARVTATPRHGYRRQPVVVRLRHAHSRYPAHGLVWNTRWGVGTAICSSGLGSRTCSPPRACRICAQDPKPLEATPLVWVRDASGVRELAEALTREAAVAVDVEHHATHSFAGLTCLVQLSTPTHDYIIDTLTGVDLAPLQGVMGDAAVVKVLHGYVPTRAMGTLAQTGRAHCGVASLTMHAPTAWCLCVQVCQRHRVAAPRLWSQASQRV